MRLNKSMFMMGIVLLILLPMGLFAAGDKEPEVKTVTVAFTKWFSDNPTREAWGPAFEKAMAKKGITVKIESLNLPVPDGPYNEKLVLDLAAGEGADIFMLDGMLIGGFAEAGYLEDLTARVNAWDEWKEWPQWVKDGVTINGKVYAIQMDSGTLPLFYRKDLFRKAGLPVPWQPKSWDELLDAARTIKNRLGVAGFAGHFGNACGECTTMNNFLNFLLAAGGRIYNPDRGKWVGDSKAMLDTWRFFETVYMKEQLAFNPEYWLSSKAIDQVHVDFADGKLGIFVTWDGVYYDYQEGGSRWVEGFDPKKDMGYAIIPAMRPGEGLAGRSFVNMAGGWTMAMKKGASDLAWEFLKFCRNKERQIAMNKTASGKKMWVRPDVVKALLPEMDEFSKWRLTEVMQYSAVRPALPVYPKVSALISRSSESMLMGKSAEEVAAAYAKDLKALVGAANVISE